MPAPEPDLERLQAARPTPVCPEFDIKNITTMPAPSDAAVIDSFETDIETSDLICGKCGVDFEPTANFCAACGDPRQKRSSTKPYLQAVKERSLTPPPMPKFDKPNDAIAARAALKPRPPNQSTYAIVEERRRKSEIARVPLARPPAPSRRSSRPPRKRRS